MLSIQKLFALGFSKSFFFTIKKCMLKLEEQSILPSPASFLNFSSFSNSSFVPTVLKLIAEATGAEYRIPFNHVQNNNEQKGHSTLNMSLYILYSLHAGI